MSYECGEGRHASTVHSGHARTWTDTTTPTSSPSCSNRWFVASWLAVFGKLAGCCGWLLGWLVQAYPLACQLTEMPEMTEMAD